LKDSLRIFLLFFLLYIIIMGGHLYSPDEEILFRMTESIACRASISITPLEGFASKKGADGKEYAQYGIGQPLLAVPFYYFGKIIYNIFPSENAGLWFLDTVQYNKKTPEEIIPRLGVSLFNQFIMALLCTVLFIFSFELTKNRGAAWMTTLLFGLGTYAFVHSKPFFTEPLCALLSFSSFFLLYKGTKKKSVPYIIIAGFLYAYSLLVRLDSLFMIPGYFIFIFLSNLAKTKQNPGDMIRSQFVSSEDNDAMHPLKKYLFFSPIILSIITLLLLNKIRFDSFFSTGYEDQAEGFKFSTPVIQGLYGYLFSAGKGLFFFSPPLFLSLFALKKFYKDKKILASGLFVLVLSFFLIQCKWQNWAGGWCWGPRHIFQLHVFLALPLCFLFCNPCKIIHRCFFWIFLVIGLSVQLYGCSQNFIDYYVEFFTTPRTQPNNFNIWYMESEPFLDRDYALFKVDPNGKMKRIQLRYLISPIQNSIYTPQNTVWANYHIMLKMGRHDFFWPKYIFRRIPIEERIRQKD
jgi:hypothetical protein